MDGHDRGARVIPNDPMSHATSSNELTSEIKIVLSLFVLLLCRAEMMLWNPRHDRFPLSVLRSFTSSFPPSRRPSFFPILFSKYR
jgi:hypothetical protein